MRIEDISLERLCVAPWLPNRLSRANRERLRNSLREFGVVETLLARPHPEQPGMYELLSGNQRLPLYQELGYETAPVVVVELDDAAARLLAQTLNRTRGTDDPQAYAELLERVLQEYLPERVAGFLPETESSLERTLAAYRPDGAGEETGEPPAQPISVPGEVYELGPHRLLCGDATDPEQVALLMAGESAALMVTDPPYGVGVDHSWRDGVRQPAGSARSATLLNDDRADWEAAYRLTDAPVAYVWHAALYCGVVMAGLAEAGFEVRQQIVWRKSNHVLTRQGYQWAHEACWYAVRKGTKGRWFGDRKETTVWEAASPIAGFGGSKQEDLVTAHPTQKPLSLFVRPILNHTKAGEIVYDPFAGSGTCLIAAAQHGRRCFAVELDPRWCDVIRTRYEQYTGKTGGR